MLMRAVETGLVMVMAKVAVVGMGLTMVPGGTGGYGGGGGGGHAGTVVVTVTAVMVVTPSCPLSSVLILFPAWSTHRSLSVTPLPRLVLMADGGLSRSHT